MSFSRTNTTYLFENRKDGHFKDYRIEVDVVLRRIDVFWGRIGGTKQHRVYSFQSETEMARAERDLMYKRYDRGYELVDKVNAHDESRDFSEDLADILEAERVA